MKPGLSQFFRDTVPWQYADVPGHTLIGAGDALKFPLKVPRFISDDELDQLMPAVNAIACPFQRGWGREVERHRCTSDRIDKLLADLGQPACPEGKPESISP
ncbi:hypothetical protein [Streptomyces uncialis]|uniref:hypothetical protein n=1 Tax=Streptomyces uncialis TaxID=1048205 RepID=UPI00225A1AD4|nr:hypothetical protein [Streptomyces uncialis]MCX4663076.1 hypothetical protein [Streptomyces uncialis]